MSGFYLAEVGARNQARHRRRGGFPPSHLARPESDSLEWRRDFVQRFLESVLPLFGVLTPALKPSMRIALEDLELDRLTVVYPGSLPYPLADKVMVVPLEMLATTGPSVITGKTGRS